MLPDVCSVSPSSDPPAVWDAYVPVPLYDPAMMPATWVPCVFSSFSVVKLDMAWAVVYDPALIPSNAQTRFTRSEPSELRKLA